MNAMAKMPPPCLVAASDVPTQKAAESAIASPRWQVVWREQESLLVDLDVAQRVSRAKRPTRRETVLFIADPVKLHQGGDRDPLFGSVGIRREAFEDTAPGAERKRVGGEINVDFR